MERIYDFKALTSKGKELDFAQFEGKVLLIVNTASKCGFTPQFAGLEQLNQEYKDRGLVVIGFPCNQFASQDPGSDSEIEGFCQLNYGVTFQIMKKVDVNGSEAPEEPDERTAGKLHQVELHQIPHLARRQDHQALCSHHQAREDEERHRGHARLIYI